jgi:hypothetical protein
MYVRERILHEWQGQAQGQAVTQTVRDIQINRVYGMPPTQVIKLRLLLRPNKHFVGIKISVEKITLKLARLEVGDPLRPKAERNVMSRYATLSE